MSAPATEAQPLKDDRPVTESFFIAHIQSITRIFGKLTVIILWISVVVTLQEEKKNNYLGYYLIPASIIVTFFEMTWIFDKLACCGRDSCCCQVWAAFMWVDNWKKFVLYIALSVPLFLEGMEMAMGVVSGFFLILLSMLYLVKTFLVGARWERVSTKKAADAGAAGAAGAESAKQTDYKSTVDNVDETKDGEVVKKEEVEELRSPAEGTASEVVEEKVDGAEKASGGEEAVTVVEEKDGGGVVTVDGGEGKVEVGQKKDGGDEKKSGEDGKMSGGKGK